ncbi:hypothetical protein DFH07DRAFT_770552 [Mycena maculata]|uniref:DUF6534 domain-containing protein n=1 Tax=Mycena maculata TaxID=230809 RepID=A0AAD7JGA7_9AGAR|nr:hypothetical protein DFH07DRAFT_770552 [Mycena maculata]
MGKRMSNIPDLNVTLGATEIGWLSSVSLHMEWGFILDRLLELGHTVSSWHALYLQTVIFYGQPQYISSPPHSEEMTILFAALLYMVVQTFYANRVRVLTGSWTIMVVASSLNTLRFIANMGSLGLLMHYSRVSILLEWRWLVSTALSLGLAVDIFITASMCYFLRKMRGRHYQRTRTIVDTLIAWSVGEGIESTVLTSTASILQIILASHFVQSNARALSDDSVVHDADGSQNVDSVAYVLEGHPLICFSEPVFSNSMLAALNGRRGLSLYDDEPSECLHFVSDASSRKDMVTVSFASASDVPSRVRTLIQLFRAMTLLINSGCIIQNRLGYTYQAWTTADLEEPEHRGEG